MEGAVKGAPAWQSEWEIIGEPSTKSEGLIGNVARHGARTIARVGETALGLPADLLNAALSGVNALQKPITGESSKAIERIQETNPFTSQNLRKRISGGLERNVLGEGYLEPQGDYEKLADSFVSDLTSILMPIGGAVGLAAKGGKIAKGAVKSAALASGLGNIAGFATKKITGSEKAGDVVRIGAMLGTALGGVPRMKEAASKGYQAVEQMIPDSLKVSTKPLNDAMWQAEKLMVPYKSTKGGKALTDYFKDTLGHAAGRTEEPLKNILEIDKGFNKVLSQNPSISYDVKKAKDLVKDAIDKTIQQAGRPDIHKAYVSARNLYRESVGAGQAQEWVKDVAHALPHHGSRLTRYTKMLLGIPAKVSGGVQEAARLLQVPEVKRYYMQTAKAAINKSRPAWIKGAHMLDKAVQKQEAKKPAWESEWEIID
jgi:hypothetical protein